VLRRSIVLLATALAGGVLLVGCGGGSKSSSSSQTPQAPSTSSSAATPTTPSTSTPSSAAAIARAVGACRAVIGAAPNLSAAVKSKVEGICNKASSGDLAGARKAAREVCAEVVNAEPVPAVVKEHARAQCKTI
jgi:hypothetical protein